MLLYVCWKSIDADDLALLSNTPAQIQPLLRSLEQAARGIDLYVNSERIEFVSFNQDGAISSLNGKFLKLVDQFIYLGSDISSTESDVNICIGKALTAILLTGYRSFRNLISSMK